MKYRKKQTVDAVQVTEAWFTAEHPIADMPVGVTVDPATREVVMGGIQLKTHLVARVGDWIVTGGGKTYPMCNDEFLKLYEAV